MLALWYSQKTVAALQRPGRHFHTSFVPLLKDTSCSVLYGRLSMGRDAGEVLDTTRKRNILKKASAFGSCGKMLLGKGITELPSGCSCFSCFAIEATQLISFAQMPNC